MVFDELAYAQSCADKARFPLKKPAGVCTLAGPNYRLLFVCAGPLRVATGTMGYKHEIDTLIGTLDYGFVPQKPRISQTSLDLLFASTEPCPVIRHPQPHRSISLAGGPGCFRSSTLGFF